MADEIGEGDVPAVATPLLADPFGELALLPFGSPELLPADEFVFPSADETVDEFELFDAADFLSPGLFDSLGEFALLTFDLFELLALSRADEFLLSAAAALPCRFALASMDDEERLFAPDAAGRALPLVSDH